MKSDKVAATLAVLALLLIVSNLFVYSLQNRVNAQSNSGIGASSLPANYANATALLQYEWPQSTGDSSFTRFSAGPAPEAPDVLWKTDIAGIQSYISAFNGKVFVTTKSSVYALDRETGRVLWSNAVPAPGPWPEVYKIDEEHMVVGNSCLDPETGEILWTSNNFSASPEPLFSLNVYSPEEKMFFVKQNSYVYAWNFADPSKPPSLVWSTYVSGGTSAGSGVQYGDGMVFPGSSEPHQMALDARNGSVLWDTNTKASMIFSGAYANGKFFRGGAYDNTFYAFDAPTGEINWTYNPGTPNGYWCTGVAVAYGMVYELNKDGNLYALDENTGTLIWNYTGPGPLLFPGNPTIADGKVYATTGQAATFENTNSTNCTSEFACLDAFTGQLIWKLPIEAYAPRESVAIAYGNLYLIPADVTTTVNSMSSDEYSTINQVWAMSTRDWTMWRHDAAHTGVGQSAPSNLTLRWRFTTGGAVISSPSIAKGVAYFGSQDKNIYAVDARSGSFIWKFLTESRVASSPAVADGRVFTGTDDGFVYCLDAYNGSLLWKTFAGGFVPAGFSAAVNLRSSPVVVGDCVYVGALDNKTYCLKVSDGTVVWAVQTEGYITSSPAVVDDAVYVVSQEPGSAAIYKLHAGNGSVIWKKPLPYQQTLVRGTDMQASPTVADGMVFVSSDASIYYALNAMTGDTVWTFEDNSSQEFIVCSPVYRDGRVYLVDTFTIVCVDAKTGIPVWESFLRDELYVSPSYADGKLYVVTNERSLYILNATNGTKVGNFSTSSNSWSSPSIYEGRLYMGSNDWNVYCFADYSALSSSITLALDKANVTSGELVMGSGLLLPKITNTSVTVIFEKPDGILISMPVSISEKGDFTFSFRPEDVGNWTVTAEWLPDRSYYLSSISESVFLSVEAAPSLSPSESPSPSAPPSSPPLTPTPFIDQKVAGIPIYYVYLAAIFGLIAVIGVTSFMLRKRTSA